MSSCDICGAKGSLLDLVRPIEEAGIYAVCDRCLYELNKINEITVAAAIEAGRAAVREKAKEMKRKHSRRLRRSKQ